MEIETNLIWTKMKCWNEYNSGGMEEKTPT